MRLSVISCALVFAASTAACAVDARGDLVDPDGKGDVLEPGLRDRVVAYEVIADSGLNCREGAGTYHRPVFALPAGTVVDVVDRTVQHDRGRQYEWLQVNPRGDADHVACWVAVDDEFLLPIAFDGRGPNCGVLSPTPDHPITSGGFWLTHRAGDAWPLAAGSWNPDDPDQAAFFDKAVGERVCVFSDWNHEEGLLLGEVDSSEQLSLE